MRQVGKNHLISRVYGRNCGCSWQDNAFRLRVYERLVHAHAAADHEGQRKLRQVRWLVIADF